MKDVSFLDKLKHTFHANLLSSTNSPTMTKYIKGQKDGDGHTIFRPDVPPGTMGDFNTANYIALWLDQSKDVWAATLPQTARAWAA